MSLLLLCFSFFTSPLCFSSAILFADPFSPLPTCFFFFGFSSSLSSEKSLLCESSFSDSFLAFFAAAAAACRAWASAFCFFFWDEERGYVELAVPLFLFGDARGVCLLVFCAEPLSAV